MTLLSAGVSLFLHGQNAWINEIHYDNTGGDVNEFIEVVIEDPGLYSLSDFTVDLYNGNGGASYNTKTLDEFTQGITSNGFTIYYFIYPANGIQNGAPDGMALSYQSVLIPGQFLSYEGTFTASGGPADGVLSTDIGVAESGSEPVGQSLQLLGSGTQYSQFTWQPPADDTPGELNIGQSFGGAPVNSISYAYSLSETALDVVYNLSVTAVDPADYTLTGTATITFSGAAIDGSNDKLVHLTGASASMAGDLIVDQIEDASIPSDYDFYAGIMPVSYTNTTNPGGTIDDVHFATFQGIVSANDNFNNVWLSDNSTAYHGVMIFDNAFQTLVGVGDEILIRAIRDTYYNLTELVSPMLISTFSTGNDPYGPAVIDGSDISETIPVDTDPAEKWEGQLVKIQNFTVDSYENYEYRCSWTDGSTIFYFHVGDNVDYHLNNIQLQTGQSYASITGVVDWSDDGPYYRINPREQSDILANPTEARIVGSFQGWNPTDPEYVMIEKPNGLLQLTKELPEGDHEYKVLEGDDWDDPSYPEQNQHIILSAASLVTWKTNIDANLVTHTPPTITGDFISELGGTDWDPATPIGEMEDLEEDDIFTRSLLIPEGNWECKVTLNKNWDQNTGWNTAFHSNGMDETLFTYDMTSNTTTVEGGPPEFATITFIIDDSAEQTFGGFYLKGSWDAEGNYDPDWNMGNEHTPLYDDGTNGDAVAGDHIFTVEVVLVVDYGIHTWEWGVNDQDHNWVDGNWPFTIPDASPQTLTQVFGTIPALVITEIMYNPPESGTDSLEFIEIYNPGMEPVLMEDFYFADGVEFTFPGISLDPDHYLLVSVNSAAMNNFFGVTALQWTDGALSNGGELLLLKDNLGRTVDSVLFDDATPWPTEPDGNGPSLVFCDPSLDNSVADDWSVSLDYAGMNAAGDSVFASPGTGCIYEIPAVMITEIMYNPPETGADSLEFIEILNRSNSIVDFDGFYFSSGIEYTFQNLQLTPGEFVVIARDKLAFQQVFGFLPLQWTSGDLDDDGETLVISDPYGNPIDVVAYDDEAPWDEEADGLGPSLTFCYPFLDNSVPEFWSASTEFAAINGDGDTIWASPLMGCTLPDFEIVITEIMYNPPEYGTDSLEFVEIYNNGIDAVDLEGMYFSDGITYTFPSVMLQPEHYLVVCVDSTAFLNTFGFSALQWTDGALSNGGEDLEIRDRFGNPLDFVAYNDELPWDTLADGFGPSLTLCDPSLDNTLPESWIASYEPAAINANGDTIYASPGAGCGVVTLPEADFMASVTDILKGMSVDFTDLSTGEPETWQWQFPGGEPSTSAEQHPVGIVYNTPGLYDVILTVANIWGEDTETRTNYITVSDTMHYQLVITEIMYNPPESGNDSLEFIEIYNNDILSIDLGGFYFSQGVTFTFPDTTMAPGDYLVVAGDAMAILNTFGLNVYQWTGGALNNDGEEVELNDRFGIMQDYVPYESQAPWPTTPDGEGPSLTLCYPDLDNALPENWNASTEFAAINQAGDTIWATPMGGCQGIAPEADFMASETTIPAGGSVDFTDLSVGEPITWYWTFEGGTPETSTEQHPQGIQYNEPGSFMVSLTVTNNLGTDTKSVDDYITVGYPPVADFEASETEITVGASVTYMDLSANDPESWNWTFPGGTPASSSDPNPVVTYNTAGDFDVTLHVVNAFGENTVVKTDYIHVAVGIEPIATRMEDILLYPVPANSTLYLENLPVPAEIEIFSLVGNKVMDLRANRSKISTDLSPLSKGVYFIRIIAPQKGNTLIRKLIIN